MEQPNNPQPSDRLDDTRGTWNLNRPATIMPPQLERQAPADPNGSGYMSLRPTFIESAAIVGFFILGVLLRTAHLEREAVEHFDEGIYASTLWYDGQFNEPYPSRHLFAPPLLSTMMEGVSWVPGLARYAPFLPSVLLGIATILGLWWLARSWFGKPAGIFIIAVVAMSDFHIIYSRMALTDVACLFWIIASVGLGTRAVDRQCFRTAAAAGFVCGLAWWTKYTGWLPLAILCSGSGLWWLWLGRKSLPLMRLTGILATINIFAAATFAPWWWQLQDVGGYRAVAETHASYVTGWSSWTTSLTQQLRDQFLFDGFTGQLSLGLGLFFAGLLRWASGRSTWNAATGRSNSTAVMTLPPMTLMLRFTAAAIALTVISFRIWTPLMLTCLAVAGLSGVYLWPVLQRSWQHRRQNNLSPTSPGALPLSPTDLECAPAIDPTLGLCTTLTWFVGMLFATPMYSPFSRLFFPLLAAIWLAAAAGIGWWLESNLSVARQIVGTGEATSRRGFGHHLVSTMLAVAVASSLFRFDENNELGLVSMADLFHSSVFSDRRSIVAAAEDIADACVRDATAGDSDVASEAKPSNLNLNSITPEALLATNGKVSDSESQRAAADPSESLSPDRRRQIRMVVYVFGEPASLFHLSRTGIAVSPVAHLNLRGPGDTPPAVPTFVVFGPNAKRTLGFWEELMRRSDNLRPVATILYAPSDVTLLDMFDPKWLLEHPEARLQSLEVHRVE